jgi:hypothetical protein
MGAVGERYIPFLAITQTPSTPLGRTGGPARVRTGSGVGRERRANLASGGTEVLAPQD